MSGEDGYVEYLISKEIADYDLEKSFTEAQKESIYMVLYRNLYRYDMDVEYAVRDAVSSVMSNEGITVPSSYKERFWVA